MDRIKGDQNHGRESEVQRIDGRQSPIYWWSHLRTQRVKWVQQVIHPIVTGKLGNQQLKIGGHSKAKILDTEIYCLLKLDCLPCLTIRMLAIFDEWICEDFLK